MKGETVLVFLLESNSYCYATQCCLVNKEEYWRLIRTIQVKGSPVSWGGEIENTNYEENSSFTVRANEKSRYVHLPLNINAYTYTKMCTFTYLPLFVLSEGRKTRLSTHYKHLNF
jgi:hypothetical protein